MRLDTRVSLDAQQTRILSLPFIPSGAVILDRLQGGLRQVLQVSLALEDVKGEARASVPSDMAVQNPCARVIGLEGDGEVAAHGEGGDVATGRVGGVGFECGRVVCLVALGNDGEVVAVTGVLLAWRSI